MKEQHPIIRFSKETEKNGILIFFLDIKLFRENSKFVTSIYRKDTRIYTNLIPLEYKFGLLHTLFHRCFC